MQSDVILLAAASQGQAPASVWEILGTIAAAGAIGGAVNALLSDNGFILVKMEAGIVRPGVLGNMILGAFAAIVTWGLYGPLKDAVLLGAHPAGEVAATLTITALVGAALAGAGGARIITNEIDKRFLRTAAAAAAARPPDSQLATALSTASPAATARATTPAAQPAGETQPAQAGAPRASQVAG